MRRILHLPLLLLACEAAPPPPGELIGTFSFEASLLDVGGGESCAFGGSPERIAFDGTLSHDPATGEAWLQIAESLRPGAIEGTEFSVGMPRSDDGTVQLVPRTLRDCACTLYFAERIEGRVVRSTATECPGEEERLALDPVATACPGEAEDGGADWATCGGVCGFVIEEVRPERGCVCEVDGERVPAEACRIVYALEGRRIGGSR